MREIRHSRMHVSDYVSRNFIDIRQLAAGSVGYGQIDFESGSLSWLALYFDSAAVILDDPVANRQAQSQPSFFFGSEKRQENLGQILRTDPEAGIGYRNSDFRAALRERPG